ncbi:MAG: hypothetical protein QJR09_08115 [Micrococcus sp.]|nr:hypothetical protein [Micrococcus sp.]
MTRREDAIEAAALTGYTKLYTETAWRNETETLRQAHRNNTQDMITAYEAHMRPEVTTVDELDNLPLSTIVMDRDGDVWRKDLNDDGGAWLPLTPDAVAPDDSETLAAWAPFRVLHWGAS